MGDACRPSPAAAGSKLVRAPGLQQQFAVQLLPRLIWAGRSPTQDQSFLVAIQTSMAAKTDDNMAWRAGPVVTRLWQRAAGASFLLSQARHAQTVLLAVLAGRGIARPVVWLPAFYAMSSIAPLLGATVDLQFYAVTPEMQPDWPALDAMAKQTPPHLLVVVHYYGTEADGAVARAFADRHGALLFEDAAHTMLPAGGVGRHGHFVCYSPRKYYGTGDGAVFVANDERSAAEVDAVAPGIHSTVGRGRHPLKTWGDRHLPWRRTSGPLPHRDFDTDWDGVPSASPAVWMSRATRDRIERLGASGAEAIRLQEIDVTQKIERHVEAATTLRALPRLAEVAPYLVGFRARTRAEAETAYLALRQAGANAGTWPDLPRIVRAYPERYGAALELRNTVVRVIPRYADRRAALAFISHLPTKSA